MKTSIMDKFKKSYTLIYVGLVTFLTPFGVVQTSAAESEVNPDHFEYPELMVVPRSSDRLQLESNKEPEARWVTYLPMQLSSISTLVAGVMSFDTTNPYSGAVGIGIGGGFLLSTVVMAGFYHPYESAWHSISLMPKGTVREQLARERAAEEEIERISDAGQRMRWISTLANFGSSAYMLVSKTNAGNALGFCAVSALFSFLPLVFDFHWHDVYYEQKDYKKRIYGPVAMPAVFQDPITRKANPGLQFAFSF